MATYDPGCKVMIGDHTIIDLTSDTVTAQNLLFGATAHDKNGNAVTGNLYPVGSLYATEDALEDPSVVLGVGSWTLIAPANTVDELKATTESFVTVGTIYIWRRTA